jgi:hypothetical protein
MLIQYNFSLIADMPKFAESIQNVTVTVGREATLTCVVDDLGSYKVSIAAESCRRFSFGRTPERTPKLCYLAEGLSQLLITARLAT